MPPEHRKTSPEPKHRAPGRLVLRTKTGRARHSGAGCKEGSHAYGPEQAIGGGIVRLICRDCGSVSIDLREAEEPVTDAPSLERKEWVLEPEPPVWGARQTS